MEIHQRDGFEFGAAAQGDDDEVENQSMVLGTQTRLRTAQEMMSSVCWVRAFHAQEACMAAFQNAAGQEPYSMGSGFLFTFQGIDCIMTNAHVIWNSAMAATTLCSFFYNSVVDQGLPVRLR